LINSVPLTASLYQTAVAVANSGSHVFDITVLEERLIRSSESYEIATPVLSRTKPILESADGLAVAT
jgi:hypothetical protein